MGSLSLLRGIFPTQGSNPGLPHCRQILYQLSHKGSPRILEWVAFLTQESNQGLLHCRRILYQLSYQGSLPSKCPININSLFFPFSYFQFSCSVVSNSLQLHGLQHPRLPCPSPIPRICSNSCPSSWWCHPIISSSVIPFSSCLQSFPASESFLMSQFFASGGQSIEASASVLPMNIQEWFPLGLTGLISQFKGLSRVFSSTTVEKHQFFSAQLSLWSNSYPYVTTGKTMALTRWTFVGKVMPLLFNMLSRLVIAFLPRSKHLLTSWLQSPSAVILEPRKESLSLFPLLPHEVMGLDAMILVFCMLSFKLAFSLSSHFHQEA